MGLQFEALNKVTLTEQVMQQIADKIMRGELKAGERLPAEREFSEMLNVSRSRVREALRALSLIGMVSIKPGDGTYVQNRIDQMPEGTIVWMFRQQINNYNEIYEARRLIESAVYEACYEHRTPEIVKTMKDFIARLEKAYKENDSAETFNQLLEEEDIYIAQNCGNSVFYKLMQIMILLRRDAALKICESPYNRMTSVEKRTEIALAFEQDDRRKVKKAINEFFDKSVKDFTFH